MSEYDEDKIVERMRKRTFGNKQYQVATQALFNKLDRYREALESISKNGCCDKCQEAKLVALSALNPRPVPLTLRERE